MNRASVAAWATSLPTTRQNDLIRFDPIVSDVFVADDVRIRLELDGTRRGLLRVELRVRLDELELRLVVAVELRERVLRELELLLPDRRSGTGERAHHGDRGVRARDELRRLRGGRRRSGGVPCRCRDDDRERDRRSEGR